MYSGFIKQIASNTHQKGTMGEVWK